MRIKSLVVAAVVAAVTLAAVSGPYEPTTGLATLYDLDPITTRVSFDDHPNGGSFRYDEVRNHGSDLDSGHDSAGESTAGIEGAREGTVVDLGPIEALTERSGVRQTVGGGQGFAAIRVDGGRLVAGEHDFGRVGHAFGDSETAPIEFGHVDLVRLTDRHDDDFERLVKSLVVDHEPDIRVTLHWVVIARDVS